MTTGPHIRTTVADIRTEKTPNTTDSRSTKMQTMHEALARDRMRDAEHRARAASLVRELAAQRRWHRVTRYAQAAERRHALRASQVAIQ